MRGDYFCILYFAVSLPLAETDELFNQLSFFHGNRKLTWRQICDDDNEPTLLIWKMYSGTVEEKKNLASYHE